jgi:phosphodiesterase/alkaline phosphatase D-like protein
LASTGIRFRPRGRLGARRRLEEAKRGAVERLDLFPQGVASADPHPDSVLRWTRRPPVGESRATHLAVEVAEDATFAHVVSRAHVALAADADWTCRMLAAGPPSGAGLPGGGPLAYRVTHRAAPRAHAGRGLPLSI